VRLEGLGQLTRTRDLPACGIVPQTNYATACPHFLVASNNKHVAYCCCFTIIVDVILVVYYYRNTYSKLNLSGRTSESFSVVVLIIVGTVLFSCGLFNNAVSGYDYIVFSVKIISR
jgi:hypothetical protein